MNNVTIKEKLKQLSIVEWFLIVLTILFLFFMLILVPNSKPLAPEEAKTEQEKTKDPTNIFSFTGNQAGYSKKFTVVSKEIKFDSRCDNGPVVCVAWLYQVGCAKQQLFHSSGSTGNFSEQKTLSIGPGTFYIEMDTRDREYKIDVFQSSTPASTEEINSAQVSVDSSQKYRDVNGFKLTDESASGDTLLYDYEPNNDIYYISLSVYPDKNNYKLHDNYTLAATSLKINNITVQYAFEKGSTLNGVQIFNDYESAEFIFIADDKTHVGFVQKINNDSNKEDGRTGIEAALKSFVNALVPNI